MEGEGGDSVSSCLESFKNIRNCRHFFLLSCRVQNTFDSASRLKRFPCLLHQLNFIVLDKRTVARVFLPKSVYI